MSYNSVIYKNRPVKFIDYINNKYDIIHKKLYEDALGKYLHDYIESIIKGKFMFRFFQLFNNYFSENPNKEISDIINISLFKNYKNVYIIPITDIDIVAGPDIDNMSYYIGQDQLIKNKINELKIFNKNKSGYLNYMIINVIFMIYRLRENVADLHNIIEFNDISDFIITYKNCSYMLHEHKALGEDKELILIQTEKDNKDIVFIYEELEKEDIHIGYNEEGKWILDIDDTIDISAEQIIQTLNNLINKTNYNMWNMFIDNIKNMYYDTHRIIEIKNTEYWQPSSIFIISNVQPQVKQTVDLSPWWNDFQAYKQLQIDEMIANETSTMTDAKIQYIDYVRGNTKIYSKSTDVERTVDLNYVHADSEIDEEATLSNTFTYKLKHITF